jgi:hypothetical protein
MKPPSQQLAKSLHREPRIPNDPTHRECVNRITARNRQSKYTIRHHDVFTLANDPEPGFLERTNRFRMRYTRKFAHTSHRDVGELHSWLVQNLVTHFQILLNRRADILKCFLSGEPLGPAAWQPWAPNRETFISLAKRHAIRHTLNIPHYSVRNTRSVSFWPVSRQRHLLTFSSSAALSIAAKCIVYAAAIIPIHPDITRTHRFGNIRYSCSVRVLMIAPLYMET